jgi:hypothetical protein
MVIRRPHLLAARPLLATSVLAVLAARPLLATSVLAVCAVLPLLAPEVWAGWRLGVSDPVLGVLSSAEQPLSVRSPSGLWAIGLALVWFGLAYRRRKFAWWEAALVLLGGAAALARLGNAWLDAAAMLAPLARQFAWIGRKSTMTVRHTAMGGGDSAADVSTSAAGLGVLAGLVALGIGAGVLTLIATRPPELPVAATHIVQNLNAGGNVLADWRWAPALQRQLGSTRAVLASGGLVSEPTDFWLDYLRIAQGHERWAELLRQMNVDVLVLDSADQQRQVAVFVRTSPDWRVIFDSNSALVAQRAAR